MSLCNYLLIYNYDGIKIKMTILHLYNREKGPMAQL